MLVPTRLNCELSHVGLVEMAFQLMAFQVIQRLALVEGRSRFWHWEEHCGSEVLCAHVQHLWENNRAGTVVITKGEVWSS